MGTTKHIKLLVLTMATLVFLSGCQFLQDSAKDVRSTIDQTVENTKTKAGELQKGVNDKVEQVSQTVDGIKTKVDETKATIDEKMQQMDEAGKKIEEAQKAISEANKAVQDLGQ